MNEQQYVFAALALYRIALKLGAPPEECEPGMVLFHRAGHGWLIYAGTWSSAVLAIGARDRLAAIDQATREVGS